MPIPAFVISDLHLGSGFCRYESLCQWLAQLPDGIELVLNGDVAHVPRANSRKEHLALLDTLREMATSRKIVWVAGNHDADCPMTDPGNIEFKQWHTVGNDLVVAHGHKFETRNAVISICFTIFRHLYRLHLKLGGPPMHVARYARRFPALFSVFKNGVSINAARFAGKHGANTVACGHTHYPEEAVVDGIRYINTGCWTDPPFHYLFVDGSTVELKEIPEP